MLINISIVLFDIFAVLFYFSNFFKIINKQKMLRYLNDQKKKKNNSNKFKLVINYKKNTFKEKFFYLS